MYIYIYIYTYILKKIQFVTVFLKVDCQRFAIENNSKMERLFPMSSCMESKLAKTIYI